MTKPTDFEIEIERLDKEISELEEGALAAPVDIQKATKFVYRLYQRASLTGDLAELEASEAALDEAIRLVGPAPDLYFVKANIDFKFHRLADVKRDLELAPDLRNSIFGRALEADLDFQEGRYDEARRGYEALIRDSGTWDNLARLAYLKFKMGDIAGAEQLYVEAEDEITAKGMRSYAWVELQRGVLDVKQGRYENAWVHYKRADLAYSGYWLVEEHIAELLGAQGRYDEAAALYERVVARVPRPEFQQALAELYDLMDNPEQARLRQEKALAGYLESTDRGGVHYYHHLADFYADVREDGREAVRWARKDAEMRENFSTLAALAWALYRDRQFAEALDTMNRALASGAKDAQMFFQAGMICLAAGIDDKGNRYLQTAAEMNPHYRSFHVHR